VLLYNSAVLCCATCLQMSDELSQPKANEVVNTTLHGTKRWRVGRTIGLILLFVVIVLALALGLGLGLGLKHHHSTASSSTAPSSTASGSSPPLPSSTVLSDTALGTVQSWRRDTADYNLDMNWDMNAAPTTRVYNLTVSEIQAAPDGKPHRANSYPLLTA
jgi:hypothetical protein